MDVAWMWDFAIGTLQLGFYCTTCDLFKNSVWRKDRGKTKAHLECSYFSRVWSLACNNHFFQKYTVLLIVEFSSVRGRRNLRHLAWTSRTRVQDHQLETYTKKIGLWRILGRGPGIHPYHLSCNFWTKKKTVPFQPESARSTTYPPWGIGFRNFHPPRAKYCLAL